MSMGGFRIDSRPMISYERQMEAVGLLVARDKPSQDQEELEHLRSGESSIERNVRLCALASSTRSSGPYQGFGGPGPWCKICNEALFKKYK